MNDQFKATVKQANLEFGMKLNKISIYSMFPVLFLLIFVGPIAYDSILGIVTYSYIILIIVVVFSKVKISIKLRNLFAKGDVDLAKENVSFLIEYFERDRFFNRLFKKNQARLLTHLHAAESMLQTM